MATSLGSLYYELALNSAGFNSDLKAADKSIAAFDKSIKDFTDKTKKVGSELNTNVTLPIVALGTAAVVAATNSEVSMKKFATAFQGAGEEASAALKELNQSYGISEAQSARLLANTGDLMKGFGASSSAALDMSLNTQKLAAALAAYNGVPVASASEKITKALLGETEGLVALGVKLNQVDIQQELVRLGQDKLTGQALLVAKANATMTLAYAQSGDAVASFSKNQDTLAFQSSALMGDLNDLGVSIGKSLLPVIKDIVADIRPAIQGFADMDDGTKKTIITVAAMAAAAGPVITAISGITAALTFLAANPIVLAIGAAAALTAGIIALSNSLNDKAIKEAGTRFGALADEIGVSGKEIVAIEKSLKGWNEVNMTGVESWSEKLGITKEQFLKIAIASDKVSESYKASAAQMLIQITQSGQLSAMEELRAEKAALAEYEKAAAIKAVADAAAKAAAQQAKVEDAYKDAREQVVAILKDEQTEQQKILEQIKVLQATPWAKGKLEEDRQAAIRVLQKKLEELDKQEAAAAKDKLDAIAVEKKKEEEAAKAALEALKKKQDEDKKAAIAKLVLMQNEANKSRLDASEALVDQQEHYAYVAAAIQTKISQLTNEKITAVALAQAQGQETADIEVNFASQLTALQDQLKANELARQAELKAQHDAYYAQQLQENIDKLAALETDRQAELAAAQGNADAIAGINATYAAMQDQLLANMAENEAARIAEMDSIQTAYYAKLQSLTTDRIAALEMAKQAEIKQAEERGLSIDAIVTAYALKEEALKKQIADEETALMKKMADEETAVKKKMAEEEDARQKQALSDKKKYETDYLDKIRADSLTKLELIQYEKEEAIRNATEAGVSIDAIETYYAKKEADQIAADAKEATDLKIKEIERYAGYTTSVMNAIGTLSDALSANQIADIDAETQATIAQYDAEIAALNLAYDADQAIRDEKAAADQAKLDKDKADLSELEALRETMRGNELQGLYDEQAELLRKEELGITLTDAEKARILDLQNIIAGGGQAELDALLAKQLAGEALTDVELARINELKAATTGAGNTQLTEINALIAAKKNAADLALAEIAANKAAQIAADAANKESNRVLENAKLKANYDAEVAKHDIAVRAFNANKVLEAGKAAVATGLAIIQAYAQLGPVAGTIAAVIVGAIGIAQQAAIWIPQPPAGPVPPTYLAQGGLVPAKAGGTTTVIGEAGDAEIVLPLTKSVYKKLGAAIVDSLQGSTKAAKTAVTNQTIQIIMDGKVLYNVVNTGLTNRSIRVPSAALIG